MQDVTNAAQTQQWAFILSQLFDWVMTGLAWIVPFQAKVFNSILQGDSFWALAGTAILLVLPAGAWEARGAQGSSPRPRHLERSGSRRGRRPPRADVGSWRSTGPNRRRRCARRSPRQPERGAAR